MPVEQATGPRLWPYVVLAVLSLLVSVVLYSAMLFLGITLAIVGGAVWAGSRTRAWRLRGTSVFTFGVAVLIGPVTALLASHSN